MKKKILQSLVMALVIAASVILVTNTSLADLKESEEYEPRGTLIESMQVTITITYPIDGLYLFGSKILPIPTIIPDVPVSLLIRADDVKATVEGDGVDHVTFWYLNINTEEEGEFVDDTPPYEWNWGSGNSPGAYYLEARAIDDIGNYLDWDKVGVIKIL